MKNLCTRLAVVSALAFSAAASAAPTAYTHVGTQNAATYTFTATSTGTVAAYFAGSTAAYTNELSMWVNGVATNINGLNTKDSAYGAMLDFGNVTAGDKLVFQLINLKPGTVPSWYSDATKNPDGIQHIYSAAYSGDNLIPAGTFVAFEDLPNGGDFNYNDETFVFTNVGVKADVPEPASLALLLIGALGFGARRTFGRAKRAA
jgi:hypothetical protein